MSKHFHNNHVSNMVQTIPLKSFHTIRHYTKSVCYFLLVILFFLPAFANANNDNAPFRQDGGAQGLVSIEAEHYHANTPQGQHQWVFTTHLSGYSGSGAMDATPNDTVNRLALRNPGYSSISPRLDYQVEFVKSGRHYIWVRGHGRNGNSASVHVGLNGQEIASGDNVAVYRGRGYGWSDGTNYIDIPSAGVYTLNVWIRETGTLFDKLVLTTDFNYLPTGLGPKESPRGNEREDNNVPDVVSTETNTAVNVDVLGGSSGTVTIVDSTTHGTAVIEADNTITYTPHANYVGQDSLSYQIIDADGNITNATFTIQVGCSSCLADLNLTLAWDPNPDVVLGYRVYYGPTSGLATQQLSDLDIASGKINAQAPSVVYNAGMDLGMDLGDFVCFQVKAYNNLGESDFSEPACTDI